MRNQLTPLKTGVHPFSHPTIYLPIMKNKLPHRAATWLLFLLPAFILPTLLPAQGVQWTSSVNVGGSNGQPWADWIFGMIHTGTAPDTTDLPAAYDYALTVLSTRNQPEDRTILVGSLASMGLYSEAQTENNLLPTGTDEYGAYRAYIDNMLGTSTDLYALPQANYNTALASLDAENVSTRAMAENLHNMRDGVYHPLIAIDPESTERSYHSQSAGDVLPAQPALAYPNPFKNEIVFDLSGLDAHLQYQIVLSDLHGRIVMTQQAQGGRILTWNGAQLADGQYTYQIVSEKEVVQNGKLLKINK